MNTENQTLLDKAKAGFPIDKLSEEEKRRYAAYLAGSENNGLKWVNASERMPDKAEHWLAKIDLQEGKLVHCKVDGKLGTGRFYRSKGILCFGYSFQYWCENNYWQDDTNGFVDINNFSKVEWLDESPSPVNEEREKELESISGHNRAIIKDLNEQRLQLAEKDARIKELEEALRKIIGIGPDDNERDFIIAAARYIQESKSLAQQALHEK